MQQKLRLGVNIDHVATVRNARGGEHPSPLRAAQLAAEAGADGITAHLREDRRHIRDVDLLQIRREVNLPLNFEMAATAEMQAIALQIRPNAVCIVPERREERTTEGGLAVAMQHEYLQEFIAPLKQNGILVSLFIAADAAEISAASAIGADIVELHTGAYAENVAGELPRIIAGAELGVSLGLEVHAGHGLNFDNVTAIAQIPQIMELNIGHFLIGEAIFSGLTASINQMRALMDKARV
jgi:pyridoxine 5-phosphate synthase